MTTEQLAQALVAVNQVERHARAHLTATANVDEQRHAQIVLRQAIALRKPIEQYLAVRACHASSV